MWHGRTALEHSSAMLIQSHSSVSGAVIPILGVCPRAVKNLHAAIAYLVTSFPTWKQPKVLKMDKRTRVSLPTGY